MQKGGYLFPGEGRRGLTISTRPALLNPAAFVPSSSISLTGSPRRDKKPKPPQPDPLQVTQTAPLARQSYTTPKTPFMGENHRNPEYFVMVKPSCESSRSATGASPAHPGGDGRHCPHPTEGLNPPRKNKSAFFLPPLWEQSLPGLGDGEHPKSRDVPCPRESRSTLQMPGLSPPHPHCPLIPHCTVCLPSRDRNGILPGKHKHYSSLLLLKGWRGFTLIVTNFGSCRLRDDARAGDFS